MDANELKTFEEGVKEKIAEDATRFSPLVVPDEELTGLVNDTFQFVKFYKELENMWAVCMASNKGWYDKWSSEARRYVYDYCTHAEYSLYRHFRPHWPQNVINPMEFAKRVATSYAIMAMSTSIRAAIYRTMWEWPNYIRPVSP